ncbi:MAG: DNA/RNA nuclease SfsA [Gammaproteobacteria bacterium]|nr:DNA/RNA nuclease SfsA [Gammaproteobacteria bacterium]
MNYSNKLVEGRLIKRYKRFLADIELATGEVITAHCANTGAMTGCQPENARVWLSVSDNPKRKYAHSWELVELENKALACINTSLTNRVVAEAIDQNLIDELSGYDELRREVVYGKEKSRIDMLLSSQDCRCYVEVKHLTLTLADRLGGFPDAVTLRGQKHVRELMQQVSMGDRAVLLFAVMRNDVERVEPARVIDPEYAKLLVIAAQQGVEILAYKTHISPQGIHLLNRVPVHL